MMIRDEVIRMAEDYGAVYYGDRSGQMGFGTLDVDVEGLVKAAYAAGQAAEREACARVYEKEAESWLAWPQSGSAKRKGAAAIRNRVNNAVPVQAAAIYDELTCEDIELLRLALSWEGYSTPESLEACAARWPSLVRDLIAGVLDRKRRTQEAVKKGGAE